MGQSPYNKSRAAEEGFGRPAGLFGNYTRAKSGGLCNFLPLTTFCAVEYGLADLLGFEGIAEGWVAGFSGFDGSEEVGDLVNEGVFVADLESGHPPFIHVGHIAIGAVDLVPAADDGVIAMVEVFEAMEVMEVPFDGRFFAVDFEGVEGFVSTGVAGGFEETERTVAEAAEEGAGIIDADFFDFTGEVVFAFLDECFGHGGNAVDGAIEPDGGIDAVCEEVAGNSGAGGGDIKSPEGSTALWQVGVDGPVLQEVSAVVEDASESTFVDESFCEGDGGNAAVVVPDRIDDAGFFDGVDHFLSFGGVHCEWFFAEDHFAGLGGSDGDFGVRVIGCADIDGVDIAAFYEFAPVCFGGFELPLVGEFSDLFFAASADGFENGSMTKFREEIVDSFVAIGVGSAHESVADETDIEGFEVSHSVGFLVEGKIIWVWV